MRKEEEQKKEREIGEIKRGDECIGTYTRV